MTAQVSGYVVVVPEGHLVHHYARAHAAALRGPLAVSSPQGRFAEATRLDGRALQAVEACGKHLFYSWVGGDVVHVHLGQKGLFLDFEAPAPAARPQVRLRMAGGERVVDLIAPSRCEILSSTGRNQIVAGLGSDPLRPEADVERVRQRLAASRAAIGAVLLDQSVIAGVGNVLRAEVLNIARIHPSRPAGSLQPEETDRVWDLLVKIMERAAVEGRIITAAPDDPEARAGVPESEGRFVYRQAHCRRCGTRVDEFPVGGRTTYVCSRCQPI